MLEAGKYNVFPLDDRRVERFNADLAGRPQLVHGNSQLLFGGMGRLTENSIVVTKNKSFAVTAEVDVPEGGAEGVIIAQGGAFGGFSLYARTAGRPTVTTCSACSASRSTGRARFRRGSTRCAWSSPTTAAGWARAALSTLLRRRDKVGEGRVDATVPMLFSA